MPTKDPRGPFSRITVAEANEMMGRDDVVVIDVRESHEYSNGHVPNAKLIPVNSIYARREELPKDKDIILGADTGTTDNMSIWFNQYNASTLFTGAPNYTREAPQSILTLALDTLDTSTES